MLKILGRTGDVKCLPSLLIVLDLTPSTTKNDQMNKIFGVEIKIPHTKLTGFCENSVQSCKCIQ
jgi:hypothetical protein